MSVEAPDPPRLPEPGPSSASLEASPSSMPDVNSVPASAIVVPARSRRPRLFTRRVLLPVLVLVLAAAGYEGYNMYENGVLYVSTDNAQVSGTPIQFGALDAGQVQAVNVQVGSAVHRGDVVAQVVIPSQVGVSQSGQPTFDFLGVSDTRVDVKAPSDGVVIATPVAPGATVAAGQPIVSIVDPSQLYVSANVDETNIERVRVGDPVTVHLDAQDRDAEGRVEAITPATAASFSLLPSNTTSGNFNKVTQLVPVRISLNLGNQPALLGTSVEVKIRVAN